MLEDISKGLQTPDAAPARKLAQYAQVADDTPSAEASSDSQPDADPPALQARAPLPPEIDKLACGRPLTCNYTTVPAELLDRQTTCFRA